MKKLVIVIALAAVSIGAFAYGHRGGWYGGYYHRGWHGGYHHRYHEGCWSRSDCHFWPGFVGGVVGGVVGTVLTRPCYMDTVVVHPATTVVTTPTVVQQPVVVQPPVVIQQPVVVQQPVQQTQTVWVEGRYVDQVQANGSVVRVWQPGHYEQRTELSIRY